MAKRTGNNGNLAFSGSAYGTALQGVFAHVYEWELNDDEAIFDGTNFEDTSGYHKHVVGMNTAVVNFRAFYDITDVYEVTQIVPDVAAATLTLTIASGKTITFTGHVHDRTTTVNKTTGIVSIDGVFTGKLTASA
jgi:hypothetical protein